MITHNVSDDAEHMAQAAREALTSPSDMGIWDERLYSTHGDVGIHWADRGDDILAESNFHAALAMLAGAVAHDETGASEERGDDVIDGSLSHWLVGSLRQVFVRVYVDPDAEHLEYTPAFKQAVEIAWSLREYPVLDESDFSDRESAAFDESVDDAIDQAARDHADDTPAERAAFYHTIIRDEYHRDAIYDAGYPDADYERVAEVYAEVRNAHFEWLAQHHAASWAPAPGQLALFPVS